MTTVTIPAARLEALETAAQEMDEMVASIDRVGTFHVPRHHFQGWAATIRRALAALPAENESGAAGKDCPKPDKPTGKWPEGDAPATAYNRTPPAADPAAPSPSPAAAPTPEQYLADALEAAGIVMHFMPDTRAAVLSAIRAASESAAAAAREEAAGLLRESEQRERHWRAEYEGRRSELAKLNRKVSGLLGTLAQERARTQPSQAEREAAEACMDKLSVWLHTMDEKNDIVSGWMPLSLYRKWEASCTSAPAAPQQGAARTAGHKFLALLSAWQRNEVFGTEVLDALDAYLAARRPEDAR